MRVWLIPLLALLLTTLAARPADPLLGLWGVADPENGTGLFIQLTESTVVSYVDMGPGDCYHRAVADYTREGNTLVLRARDGDEPERWSVSIEDGLLVIESERMGLPPLPRAAVAPSSLRVCEEGG